MNPVNAEICKEICTMNWSNKFKDLVRVEIRQAEKENFSKKSQVKIKLREINILKL